MKAIHYIMLTFVLTLSTVNAKDHIIINKANRIAYQADVNNIDSITFTYRASAEQPFIQDAAFAKIYATLGLTGDQQPAGLPDITDIDESQTSFIRQIWTLNELTTDEAICAWMDPGLPDLNFNRWRPTTIQFQGLYARLKFNIKLCNQFLYHTSGHIDAISIRQRAEVHFLHALNHYYLLDMFGNVPFTTDISYDLPLPVSRADLYSRIADELLNAEPDMFEPRQAPYYRADKAAAWLLLSRLYLNAEVYTGTAHYQEAANFAKKVLDSSYRINPSYAQLFMADNAGILDGSSLNTASQEIILPIACDGLTNKNWNNSLFLIASTRQTDMPAWGGTQAWGGNRARAALVKKFLPNGILPTGADLTDLRLAAGDDRAMFFASNRTVDITTPANFREGLSVFKFTNIRFDGRASNDIQFTDTDVPLLRIGEAYLTYAESLFRLGNRTDALTYINILRRRSHAADLLSLNYETIIDEWSREFYFEGRRRTDLIRFGNYWNNYNWDWKGGIQTGQMFGAYNTLFPIPQEEMDLNPNLSQNPGY